MSNPSYHTLGLASVPNFRWQYSVYFDEIIFKRHDSKAGDISDHRPIWAEFRIDLEDDDGGNDTGVED